MSVSEICSYYKSIGILDARLAFDHYIIDSGLKPSCNAQDFHALFKISNSFDFLEEIHFVPNLFDTLTNQYVYIKKNLKNNVWYVVWQDGTTGTFPPCDPPNPERFIYLFEMKYE